MERGEEDQIATATKETKEEGESTRGETAEAKETGARTTDEQVKEEGESNNKKEDRGEYVYSLAGGCATELDLYFIFCNMEIATKG